tara:strand:- start:1189 stop:1491 length:303 start_codon:yes stop_codon:yes gene_type:complete
VVNKLLKPLLKLIFPKIDKKIDKMKYDLVDHFAKIFKMDQLLRYMELPNEADIKIKKLETQINMIAKDIKPSAIDEKEWEEVKATIKKIKKLRVFKSLGK